jgi:enoyl reductase-like protein
MADYNSGKVYRIFVEGAEEFCYIGSTIQSLNSRLLRHKTTSVSAEYKCASAPLFEDDNNVIIELLEAYPCNSKQELLTKEAEWLLKFPEALNKNTPVLDAEERHRRRKALCLKNYYEDKERRNKSSKEYKEANKQRIAEQRASPDYLAHQNELRKIRMTDPNYAKVQKERMAAAKKAKVICQHCQKEMNKNSLSDHIKRLH